MKHAAVLPLVLALGLGAAPQIAAAATFDAFAAVAISFATNDGTNAVRSYTRQGSLPTDLTEGDGVNTFDLTLVSGTPLGVPVFTSGHRVDARSVAAFDGLASLVFEVREQFFVARNPNENREITITLAPLDGLGGLFLQVFGQSQSDGDIGAGSATITLERSGFEGTLFAQSVFANLVGVEPGDFANSQANLVPTSIDAVIPQLNGEGDDDVVFTLTYRLQTDAIAEPQVIAPDPGVIPLPPAAPLLVFGVGCIALLRVRQSG